MKADGARCRKYTLVLILGITYLYIWTDCIATVLSIQAIATSHIVNSNQTVDVSTGVSHDDQRNSEQCSTNNQPISTFRLLGALTSRVDKQIFTNVKQRRSICHLRKHNLGLAQNAYEPLRYSILCQKSHSRRMTVNTYFKGRQAYIQSESMG